MIRTSQKIKMIKIAEIFPNPYQIRRKFEEKALRELSLSIKEVGMLSPVILRKTDNGYETVCGQRRIRAAHMINMEEVPAIIVRAGDAQCAELSIIENIHRENIGFFEEAEGYFNLMSYHKIKKNKLIENLSTDSFKINEKVRLLSLPEKVRFKIESESIEEKTAKELLRIHNEEKQIEIIEKAEKEGLNYRETCMLIEKAILEMKGELKTGTKKGEKIISVREKTPLYINTVKKTVDILKKHGAKVDFQRVDTEEYTEFRIKTYK